MLITIPRYCKSTPLHHIRRPPLPPLRTTDSLPKSFSRMYYMDPISLPWSFCVSVVVFVPSKDFRPAYCRGAPRRASFCRVVNCATQRHTTTRRTAPLFYAGIKLSALQLIAILACYTSFTLRSTFCRQTLPMLLRGLWPSLLRRVTVFPVRCSDRHV